MDDEMPYSGEASGAYWAGHLLDYRVIMVAGGNAGREVSAKCRHHNSVLAILHSEYGIECCLEHVLECDRWAYGVAECEHIQCA